MSEVASSINNEKQEALAKLFADDMRDELSKRLEGTNINKQTLLTTDYLNHFNSIFMILEMLPSDPNMFAEDIRAWEPKQYAEHLVDSGFRESDLAIICYEHLDSDVRKAFDKITAQLDDAVKLTIERIEDALGHDNLEGIHQICGDCIPQIRQLVEDAASIVNGDRELIAGISKYASSNESTSYQQNVDALFNRINI